MTVDTASRAQAGSDEQMLSFIEAQLDSPLSDGLPVVPPTANAVAAFVERAGLPGDQVLGNFRPSEKAVTVRQLAVAGVMAGCKPEYMPVLMATARALMDEEFDIWGVSCSTKGSAPLIIINGPVREELGVNCRTNVFGPGFRANSTIGRAARLMILNFGGARPNELDKGTLGHSGRFSYCIGEDEEASPWTPLHVERGLLAGDSAVTVFGGEGMRLINIHYNSADALLAAVCETLASVSIYNANNIVARMPHVLVFAKEHRDLLHSAGWTKRSIREFVAENAVISEEMLRRVDGEASGPARVVEDSGQILIVGAGGHAGRFAGLIPGWSWQSQPVTVKIDLN